MECGQKRECAELRFKKHGQILPALLNSCHLSREECARIKEACETVISLTWSLEQSPFASSRVDPESHEEERNVCCCKPLSFEGMFVTQHYCCNILNNILRISLIQIILIQINETEDKNKIWNQITIHLRTQWENYQLLKNGTVTVTIWKKI